MTGSDPLEVLGPDVVLLIMEQLSLEDLVVAETVSTSWRKFLANPYAWRNAFLDADCVPPGAKNKALFDQTQEAPVLWRNLCRLYAATDYNWKAGNVREEIVALPMDDPIRFTHIDRLNDLCVLISHKAVVKLISLPDYEVVVPELKDIKRVMKIPNVGLALMTETRTDETLNMKIWIPEAAVKRLGVVTDEPPEDTPEIPKFRFLTEFEGQAPKWLQSPVTFHLEDAGSSTPILVAGRFLVKTETDAPCMSFRYFTTDLPDDYLMVECDDNLSCLTITFNDDMLFVFQSSQDEPFRRVRVYSRLNDELLLAFRPSPSNNVSLDLERQPEQLMLQTEHLGKWITEEKGYGLVKWCWITIVGEALIITDSEETTMVMFDYVNVIARAREMEPDQQARYLSQQLLGLVKVTDDQASPHHAYYVRRCNNTHILIVARHIVYIIDSRTKIDYDSDFTPELPFIVVKRGRQDSYSNCDVDDFALYESWGKAYRPNYHWPANATKAALRIITFEP